MWGCGSAWAAAAAGGLGAACVRGSPGSLAAPQIKHATLRPFCRHRRHCEGQSGQCLSHSVSRVNDGFIKT